MVRVTFQGFTRDAITDRVTWFKPFQELLKTEAEARLKAFALNWFIVDIEEIRPEIV